MTRRETWAFGFEVRRILAAVLVLCPLTACTTTHTSSATPAPTVDLSELAQPYEEADEVLASFRELQAAFVRAGDARGAFLTVYLVTTEHLMMRLNTGFYEDDAYATKAIVVFANLYREALYAHDTGQAEHVPEAWRIAHDAAVAGAGSTHELVMLGIVAHIRDLAYAVEQLPAVHPAGNSKHDFFAVDRVLALAVDDAQCRLAAGYGRGIAWLDRIGGRLDERLALRRIFRLRRQAWVFGQDLLRAEDDAAREAVVARIERRSVWEGVDIQRMLPGVVRCLEGASGR